MNQVKLSFDTIRQAGCFFWGGQDGQTNQLQGVQNFKIKTSTRHVQTDKVKHSKYSI